MSGKGLRHGFTTGACAAAAAKGAALMLREQRRFDSVELALPAGFSHRFELHGQRWDETSAHCFVVKDAGDDPDVTHGVEVHAEVFLGGAVGADPRVRPLDQGPPKEIGRTHGFAPAKVIIEGGVGIGRVTKPGLAVPVGGWAINPMPRRMITEAVLEVFPPHSFPLTPHVVISVPDGVERARRTLNERLGIVGGLSILGTTGVVKPISHRAWTDTLEVALDVALAGGCATVVLSTGRTSEQAAQRFLQNPPPPLMGGGRGEGDSEDGTPALTLPHRGGGKSVQLPDEAFVMMGDHVGYAFEACHRKGVSGIVLAAQFAKLVKVACGHAQTHAGSSSLDLARLADWSRMLGLDEGTAKKIECANTAREVLELLGPGHPLVGDVADRALERLRQWAAGAAVAILLVDYEGRIAGRFGRAGGFDSKG